MNNWILFMNLYIIIFVCFISYTNAKLIWKLNINKGCNNFIHINLDGNDSKCISNDNYLKLLKPKNNNRAEVHGIQNITFHKNNLYYINWNFMIDNSVTNNAIFQWKAYGKDIKQNYPIVIKTIDKQLVLEQYQPNKVKNTLFKSSIEINKWYNQTIGIYVSDLLKGGYIEYWFNGKQQKLLNNSTYKFKCRTFDGTYIDSKWGIYGAYDKNYNSYIRNIKISTKYSDI